LIKHRTTLHETGNNIGNGVENRNGTLTNVTLRQYLKIHRVISLRYSQSFRYVHHSIFRSDHHSVSKGTKTIFSES